jgi:hypothetical protein
MDNTNHDDVIDLGIASVETLGVGEQADDPGGTHLISPAGILAE